MSIAAPISSSDFKKNFVRDVYAHGGECKLVATRFPDFNFADYALLEL